MKVGSGCKCGSAQLRRKRQRRRVRHVVLDVSMSVVRDTNVPVDSMTQILTTRQKIVCTNVVVQNSHLRPAVTELTLQALRKTGFLAILSLTPRLIVSLQKASDFVECFVEVPDP